jgi:hypothetical protein
MNATLALLLWLCTVTPAADRQPAHWEKEAVVYAKAVDVASLDERLQSQPLVKWLQAGPAEGASIRWRATACGLKHAGKAPAGGWPLCVEFIYVVPDDVSIWGSVEVGTLAKGIVGPPRYMRALLSTPALAAEGKGENAQHLSELPPLVAKHRKAR